MISETGSCRNPDFALATRELRIFCSRATAPEQLHQSNCITEHFHPGGRGECSKTKWGGECKKEHHRSCPLSSKSKEIVAARRQHLHREAHERRLYFYAGEGSQKIMLYLFKKYYVLAPGLFSKNLFLEIAYLSCHMSSA